MCNYPDSASRTILNCACKIKVKPKKNHHTLILPRQLTKTFFLLHFHFTCAHGPRPAINLPIKKEPQWVKSEIGPL